ncbi:MAG TPA: ferritin-like domain-containing protein [Marinagarivorans sp.]
MGLYSHLNITSADDLLQARNLVPPTRVSHDSAWTLEKLQEHLQWAVDIELYTIPFYMASMYSIKDQSAEARRLLRSVVNQEMLHMQCAANIANAYGTELVIRAPSYGGAIPHLDFALDTPNPTEIFTPYSTTIGPLDVAHINAMCIIEFPDWDKCHSQNEGDEYGSIGEFYKAVRRGAVVLADNIQANRNQVGHFKAIYPDAGSLTITEQGEAGLAQVNNLINLIVDQGEGDSGRDARAELSERTDPLKGSFVDSKYQNNVDDLQPTWDHFEKFSYLRGQPLPETYPITFGSDRGREVQDILLGHFGEFLIEMNKVFRGQDGRNFGNTMYKVGAGIAACWENGVAPIFAKPAEQQENK